MGKVLGQLRVERKLRQFGEVIGLVVGALGECSEDLHELVQEVAESKAKAMGLRQGREASGQPKKMRE